ncbi:MAG: aminotransferase class V-fold PLP-dependent enzyme, partial [Erysipelotrichia bacterium]|nr:aminotransferase class V-fold PLP-dependent enzyme [Erysipelotrichia bacterium]
MLDVENLRKDFPMIRSNPDLVYFDNAATTFKPQTVIDAVTEFYTMNTSNVERGDYPLAARTDSLFNGARTSIARLINCDPKEICFTANDTAAMNQIAYGMQHNFLKEGEVILTTEAEHASNLLPWFRMEKESGIKVEFIETDLQGRVSPENIRNAMHTGVKAIALAEVTNVLGSLQPIKEAAAIAHENGALMIVDGAQS